LKAAKSNGRSGVAGQYDQIAAGIKQSSAARPRQLNNVFTASDSIRHVSLVSQVDHVRGR
jgi:hypothetical protein